MRRIELSRSLYTAERGELDSLSEGEQNAVAQFEAAGYTYLDHGRSRVVFNTGSSVLKVARPLPTGRKFGDGVRENKVEADQWTRLSPEQRTHFAELLEYDSSEFLYVEMEHIPEVVRSNEALGIYDCLNSVGLTYSDDPVDNVGRRSNGSLVLLDYGLNVFE